MSFDLVSWLKAQVGDYKLDIPLVDVSSKSPYDEREWLVTNGLGSYASGSICGAATRRYHGLLVAALDPPVKRTLLLARIDEVVDGRQLATNFWTSGAITPEGYKKLVAFTVYPVPTWVFELPNGYLVKQVAMVPGKQEVVIGYSWLGEQGCHLSLHLLVNSRDFHGQTQGSPGWQFHQEAVPGRVKVRSFESAQELVLAFSRGAYRSEPSWYWHYYWPREHERGLPLQEDNFHIGVLEISLEPGNSVTVRAGLNSNLEAGSVDDAVRVVAAHHRTLLAKASHPACEDLKKLVIAADSFVVDRHSTSGKSIIAGYHWFSDWGRDTMISLPGLTLSTGRAEIAREILKTFGQYLSQGMLPNTFPDSGMTPLYNTADATFWWACALLKYFQSTQDVEFVSAQLPLLDSVVTWHEKGTRYGLRVDPKDGLVSGGEAGVQLTWMDAKVDDFVVTPRQGKAVEINALWFNFLKTLEYLSATSGGDGSRYRTLADKARNGFSAFWNAEKSCLFDVLREDGTKDACVRPNQLIALSLPFDILSADQAQSVLKVVEQELLTPVGLRTLSPNDPDYKGSYGEGKAVATQYDRDITYHQGTVWPWLLGPWVEARIKVYGATKENFQFVADHLRTIRQNIMGEAGLGFVSEIFDGDAPHRACGAIAQAWSVAELLRVLTDYPQLQ